ncbi:MAG TPA: FmdB family zinc ribbon protein [Pyrinomonadaceae bacterium]|jgi:putative FmdB family regulatory protein|nr:FmdB family zinc ribbon protein [Pyrinomonadaceae bacterium]
MPIYEYECKKCKAHIEVLQKMTDKPLAKCGKCGGRLEKQWSTGGFQFVGSGWYVTDYAAKKSDGKEEKKGAAAAEGATGGDKSSNKESKAATKETKTVESKTASTKTSSSSDTSGD